MLEHQSKEAAFAITTGIGAKFCELSPYASPKP